MSSEDIGEMDLLAYVDDLLDPARRRAVEDYLANHPEAAERVAADMAITTGIRGLYAATYDEAPPASLTAVLKPSEGRSWQHPLALVTAALALVAVGALGGWWTAGGVPGEPLVEQLVDGTLPNGNLVPVSNKSTNSPLTWLVEGVRHDLRAPDLTGQGFDLIGEALIARANRPVVRLSYADRGGRHLDLFVEPRWDKDLPLRQQDAGGHPLVAWGHGPAVFALTGSVPAGDLQALAAIIQTGAAKRPDPGPPPDPAIKPVADVPR